ncbi:hypothetical protein [Kitasatospora griseola]|uniref:hypothetical protein n=1 Tax=Kitasatospora griseola TaxID=2064 RepID=UPI00341C845A
MPQSGTYHFYIAYAGSSPVAPGIAAVDPATGRIRATANRPAVRSLTTCPNSQKLYEIGGTGNFAVLNVEDLRVSNEYVFSQRAQMRWQAASPSSDGQQLFFLDSGGGVTVVSAADPDELTRELKPTKLSTRTTLAVTPDGKRFYTGSAAMASNRASVPDVLALGPAENDQSNPLPIATATTTAYQVNVLLSPDSATLYAWIANSTDPMVAIDTATMTITARGAGRAPSAVAVHPDGSLYTVDRDRGGIILAPATLSETGTFPCAPDSAAILAFGPDGKLCVAQANRTCIVVDTATGQASGPARLTGQPAAAVAAAPTLLPQREEPKYVAEFKREGWTYHPREDGGIQRNDFATPAGTQVSQPGRTITGQYRWVANDLIWRPFGPLGESKYFYSITDWDGRSYQGREILVDGDDLTWY